MDPDYDAKSDTSLQIQDLPVSTGELVCVMFHSKMKRYMIFYDYTQLGLLVDRQCDSYKSKLSRPFYCCILISMLFHNKINFYSLIELPTSIVFQIDCLVASTIRNSDRISSSPLRSILTDVLMFGKLILLQTLVNF